MPFSERKMTTRKKPRSETDRAVGEPDDERCRRENANGEKKDGPDGITDGKAWNNPGMCKPIPMAIRIACRQNRKSLPAKSRAKKDTEKKTSRERAGGKQKERENIQESGERGGGGEVLHLSLAALHLTTNHAVSSFPSLSDSWHQSLHSKKGL